MEYADNSKIFYIFPHVEEIWRQKYDIITGIYGFNKDSFEAKTTPREEAFWRFKAIC